MPRIRCPQCGAVNDTRAPDYPFCVGCQENLAKCGYCQWFDDQAGTCAQELVAGEFEVGPEVAPPCGYHSPRPAMRARRDGRRMPVIGLGLAAALFALAYGLIRLFVPPAEATRPPGRLQLAVEADYRGARVGETYTVMAQIYNTSDVVVEDARFEIAREFLTGFELARVTPEPVRIGQTGKWRVLEFPTMHPREQRTIRLDLVPKSSGTFHLIVQLVSGKSAYHGMADLPIMVEDHREDSADRREEEAER